jgi:hypothetical protein
MENLSTFTVCKLNSMNRRLDTPVFCGTLEAAVKVAEDLGAREGQDLVIASVMGIVASWSPEAGISFKVSSMAPRHRSCWGF